MRRHSKVLSAWAGVCEAWVIDAGSQLELAIWVTGRSWGLAADIAYCMDMILSSIWRICLSAGPKDEVTRMPLFDRRESSAEPASLESLDKKQNAHTTKKLLQLYARQRRHSECGERKLKEASFYCYTDGTRGRGVA